jgi:histone deacetylase 6
LNNFPFVFPYVNEQLDASSESESDSEDVAELLGTVASINVIEVAGDAISEHLSKMKIDDDNLAVKTTSSCSAAQQHPVDSVKVQNNTSVVLTKRISDLSLAWRSDLSKTDVWYASFGSNMWRPRFLCYVQGGKVKFKTHIFFMEHWFLCQSGLLV